MGREKEVANASADTTGGRDLLARETSRGSQHKTTAACVHLAAVQKLIGHSDVNATAGCGRRREQAKLNQTQQLPAPFRAREHRGFRATTLA